MILPSDTEELRKVIERQWSHALSLSEYRLLMMVFDRTMGWGKVWEKITYRQFTNGVKGSDGTVWHCGTGLTPATVCKGLGRLTEMRLLFRDDRGRYSLNQAWTPMMKEPKKVRSTEPTLARPRKPLDSVQTISTEADEDAALQFLKRRTSNSKVEPLQNLKPNVAQRTWNRVKIETVEQSSTGEPDEAEDTTAGALLAAEAAITARRKVVVDRMKKGAAKKQADLETVWVEACVAREPHYLHVAWTGVQKARLASIFRRFPVAERGATFVEFLTTVVQQWSHFRAQLPWARFPDEPTVGPFLTQYQAVLDLWKGDRLWNAATGSAPAPVAPKAKAKKPVAGRQSRIVAAPAEIQHEDGITVAAAPRSLEESL